MEGSWLGRQLGSGCCLYISIQVSELQHSCMRSSESRVKGWFHLLFCSKFLSGVRVTALMHEVTREQNGSWMVGSCVTVLALLFIHLYVISCHDGQCL